MELQHWFWCLGIEGIHCALVKMEKKRHLGTIVMHGFVGEDGFSNGFGNSGGANTDDLCMGLCWFFFFFYVLAC